MIDEDQSSNESDENNTDVLAVVDENKPGGSEKDNSIKKSNSTGSEEESSSIDEDQISDELDEDITDAYTIQDAVFVTGSLDLSRIVEIQTLRENTFFQETIALAESLLLLKKESEDFETEPSLYVYASNTATISDYVGLEEFYTDQNYLSIATNHSLTISGDVVLDPITEIEKTYLSLVTSGSIDFKKKSSLTFGGDDLQVGSGESMEVVNVSMESGKNLSLQSLDDLLISRSDLRVRTSDQIFLSAQRDLMLNSVNFSDNIRNIYMEATTIDLMNINFPSGSQVDMTTLYGGLEGKYPTFPGDAREVGRVNFIENVRYNQNLMDTKSQFDLHGKNIHIHSLQP